MLCERMSIRQAVHGRGLGGEFWVVEDGRSALGTPGGFGEVGYVVILVGFEYGWGTVGGLLDAVVGEVAEEIVVVFLNDSLWCGILGRHRCWLVVVGVLLLGGNLLLCVW